MATINIGGRQGATLDPTCGAPQKGSKQYKSFVINILDLLVIMHTQQDYYDRHVVPYNTVTALVSTLK